MHNGSNTFKYVCYYVLHFVFVLYCCLLYLDIFVRDAISLGRGPEGGGFYGNKRRMWTGKGREKSSTKEPWTAGPKQQQGGPDDKGRGAQEVPIKKPSKRERPQAGDGDHAGGVPEGAPR